MTSLPPYSTYRTDAKQMMFPQATSHGNILTFTPPGFKQTLNVKFPDSRLAVCDKCKKNFKTRDMCRVRNTHTAPPWTTAYVCITIDDSCLDEDGKYIDKPMTLRMVQWQPYAVKKSFDPKTPVCAGCKRTNRTRSFCRDRHKHRQLPWCTVYVLLSALDQADPSTIVAGASQPVEVKPAEEKEGESKEGENENGANGGKAVGQGSPAAEGDKKIPATAPSPANTSVTDSVTPGNANETISSDVDDQGDDINDIPGSRTFLAKVSSRGSSIHWLDLLEYEGNGSQPFASQDPAAASTTFAAASSGPPTLDPANPQAHYLAQAHYAQQHQNALKSQQQYFFQLQQRQQQQFAQWSQHHQQYTQQQSQLGQGDGAVTAGEAAAASQRRQGEDAATPTGQWPLYYHPHYATLTTGGEAAAASQDQYTNSNNVEGSEDEPDTKRHRAV